MNKVEPVTSIPFANRQYRKQQDLVPRAAQANLAPVYTHESIGPAHPDYLQPDGFTQIRVLELSQPIAHFKGPFAKINAGKFLKIKQMEVSL